LASCLTLCWYEVSCFSLFLCMIHPLIVWALVNRC
jgi:hypothetical protein